MANQLNIPLNPIPEVVKLIATMAIVKRLIRTMMDNYFHNHLCIFYIFI